MVTFHYDFDVQSQAMPFIVRDDFGNELHLVFTEGDRPFPVGRGAAEAALHFMDSEEVH
jgi:hypothetical protein